MPHDLLKESYGPHRLDRLFFPDEFAAATIEEGRP
jgi:hypothetical protein